LSRWQLLLDRAISGLDRLRKAGQPVPDWRLGGGTGLMIHVAHRISKDIDAFIDDPQYLAFLSPRLGGESVWACEAYDEAAHHLKLVFPEGEIDFIVAAPITNLPTERKTIDLSEIRPGTSHVIDVEHPVEIALKKLNYRANMLKVRDIFDIAVVETVFPDLLRDNLSRLANLKPGILARLNGISEEFLHLELDELDISGNWREQAGDCRRRVLEIIKAIPEPKHKP
jgi:nucleotidyltransferase AbiEii toxin of type IV toxin-antitoxin system